MLNPTVAVPKHSDGYEYVGVLAQFRAAPVPTAGSVPS